MKENERKKKEKNLFSALAGKVFGLACKSGDGGCTWHVLNWIYTCAELIRDPHHLPLFGQRMVTFFSI